MCGRQQAGETISNPARHNIIFEGVECKTTRVASVVDQWMECLGLHERRSTSYYLLLLYNIPLFLSAVQPNKRHRFRFRAHPHQLDCCTDLASTCGRFQQISAKAFAQNQGLWGSAPISYYEFELVETSLNYASGRLWGMGDRVQKIST